MPQYRRKKKRIILRWLFIALTVSVAGNFVWNIVSKSNLLVLEVHSVTISGNRLVSKNRIIDVLELKKYRANILKINISHLEDKLKKLPRIKDVRIKRDFPNSLKVLIKEVEPVGYLIKKGNRYVVTASGDSFPGIEGAPIKFKVHQTEKLKRLSDLLIKIRSVNKDFYNKIVAIDLNYRNEVIIHGYDCYYKWPVISKINDWVIDRNIYLIYKVIRNREKENKKISYIDLRFIEPSGSKVSGAVIIK